MMLMSVLFTRMRNGEISAPDASRSECIRWVYDNCVYPVMLQVTGVTEKTIAIAWHRDDTLERHELLFRV